MKLKSISFIILIVLTVFFSACKDDNENYSIIGKWQGTQSNVQGFADGLPIAIYDETDDEFNGTVEFKEDGTIIVSDESVETEGTWEYTGGNKKIIATVDFQNEFLEPTETLTIKALSDSKLTLFLEKHGTQDVPDYGEVTGTVKITLKFDRM